MTTFNIADISAGPGELRFGKLPVCQMRDGTTVFVPLMVMTGAHPGPKLWVDAAAHGNEISGVEVIRRSMREEVKPDDLRGIIVAAPVLNPIAFSAGTGVAQLSAGEANLNRLFPGKPDGSLFERVAHRVFTEGMLKCDYVISFHSNFSPAVEFSCVVVGEDKSVQEASIALAEAYGFPLCEIKGAQGWSPVAVQNAGKPAIIVELLYQGYLNQRSIQSGVAGMLNALRHLGMLEGEVQPLPNLKVPPGRYGRGTVMSNAGGLATFRKDAGDWVDTGEVIAVIRNVYGDKVEEVRAPMQGYIRTIMFGPHNEAVHEGAIMASVLEKDPERDYLRD